MRLFLFLAFPKGVYFWCWIRAKFLKGPVKVALLALGVVVSKAACRLAALGVAPPKNLTRECAK